MSQVALEKKSILLGRIINLLSDLYHEENTDEQQKALLETLIGAAIWYLPTSRSLFSGKISEAALQQIKLNDSVKLVEEHGYPRKVAGNKLFTEHLDEIKNNPLQFKKLFVEKFGKYNLVLKEENLALKKFQKTSNFISEETSYNLAGIKLTTPTTEEYYLPQLKRYFSKSLLKLEKINNDSLKKSELEKETMINLQTVVSITDQREEEFSSEMNIDICNKSNFKLKIGVNEKTSQTFERFMMFIIDNYSSHLTQSNLQHYFKVSRTDPAFGSAIKYNRIKKHKEWYYSTYSDSARKTYLINKISRLLNINVVQ